MSSLNLFLLALAIALFVLGLRAQQLNSFIADILILAALSVLFYVVFVRIAPSKDDPPRKSPK